MIVYFSATARNLDANAALYRSMQRTIQGMGHVIAYDWVETSWQRQQRTGSNALDVNMVHEVAKSLESSELVIAEATGASAFGVGYEVSLALQNKKPVLVLINKQEFETSYAFGLQHEFLTVRSYEGESYIKTIETFIRDNTVNTKDLRFNFVIDRQIHNHLRRKSYETGKTKAEVVRDLLMKDIEDRT